MELEWNDLNAGKADNLDITVERQVRAVGKKNRWWEERVGESRGGRSDVGQSLPEMRINLPLNYYYEYSCVRFESSVRNWFHWFWYPHTCKKPKSGEFSCSFVQCVHCSYFKTSQSSQNDCLLSWLEAVYYLYHIFLFAKYSTSFWNQSSCHVSIWWIISGCANRMPVGGVPISK